jgi:U6 snRNA-associated Sm-like protein LSm6
MENHNITTSTAVAPQPSDPKDPASFLSSIIGVPVTVKLNSGVVYKGELQSVDGYMNIALEKCVEYVEGKVRRKYGDAFVRGNNGTLNTQRARGKRDREREIEMWSGMCGGVDRGVLGERGLRLM